MEKYTTKTTALTTITLKYPMLLVYLQCKQVNNFFHFHGTINANQKQS